MFEEYSPRARRVIFWSLHYARAERSGYIEPEHILQALLLEDAQLFNIVAPERPSLVQDLKSALAGGHLPAFKLTDGKELPLSPPGRVVVAEAGVQRRRLGHRAVATQHLLLALLTTRTGSWGWLGRKHESHVQQLLSHHGITAELVRDKTKEGIVTPMTWIMDDAVIALNGRLAALAEILIVKGVFTRAEFTAAFDKREGPFPPEIFLLPLVQMLRHKNVLTSSEQEKIEGTATVADRSSEFEPDADTCRNNQIANALQKGVRPLLESSPSTLFQR